MTREICRTHVDGETCHAKHRRCERWRHRGWLGVATMVVLVGFLGIVFTPTVVAARNLVIGVAQLPTALHPLIDSLAAKQYLLGFSHRALTGFNEVREPVCMMCVRLPTIENGGARVIKKDGAKHMEFDFSLRPGAKWGDGTQVTTRDVIFTWQVGKNPVSGVSVSGKYREIQDIRVVSEREFTVELNRVSYDFADFSSFAILPEHIESEFFANPSAYSRISLYKTAPLEPGLWSGPYLLDGFRPSEHAVFRRNPHWSGDKPAFEEITVQLFSSSSALEAALLSGEVDMVSGDIGLPIARAALFESRHGERYQIVYEPSLVLMALIPNLSHPALSDVLVRRALLHGTNRKGIIEHIYDGLTMISDSFVSPFEWYYLESGIRYKYDTKRAEELLDEAGWRRPDGSATGTRTRDGVPLRIEVRTTAGDLTRIRLLQIIADDWKRLGVDVQVRTSAARVLLAEDVPRRKFSGFVLLEWLSSPEWLPRSLFHSKSIPTAVNNFSGENFMGWNDLAADDFIDVLAGELDQGKREEYWHQLQARFSDQLPLLPLFSGANMHLLPKWLENFRPTSHEGPSSQWVEYWKAKQSK